MNKRIFVTAAFPESWSEVSSCYKMNSFCKMALLFMLLDAVLMVKVVNGKGITDEEMKATFNHFDVDKDGQITENDVKLLGESGNSENIQMGNYKIRDLQEGIKGYLILHGGRMTLDQFTTMVTDGKSLSRFTKEDLVGAGLEDGKKYTLSQIAEALKVNDYDSQDDTRQLTIDEFLEELNPKDDNEKRSWTQALDYIKKLFTSWSKK